MAYQKQAQSSGDKLPSWDWEKSPTIECALIKSVKGKGKGEGLTFHEVEEETTMEKYSLLGGVVLDGIFAEAGPGTRVRITFEGMKKVQEGKGSYKSYSWEKWV
jgi:hypothetical protein